MLLDLLIVSMMHPQFGDVIMSLRGEYVRIAGWKRRTKNAQKDTNFLVTVALLNTQNLLERA
jgi:hypothetical protein